MAEEQGIIIGTEEQREAQRLAESDLQFYQELYDRRIYHYDAVSGAQIRVQLGENVIVDDCTAVQFTLTQAKKPIFGYASQLFDTVAPGIVLVQGRLFINFIHQGYLRTLIEAAIKNSSAALFQPADTLAGEARRRTLLPETHEDILSVVKEKNLSDLVDLEDPAVGGDITDRPDEKSSIDIRIKYADETVYGQTAPVKRIMQVHFIGEGQEIQISGQPVQEWYEFLAQRVL